MTAIGSDAATDRRDLVVVGASAGGIETLRRLLADLPVDFPAAVLVVVHLPPNSSSALSTVLGRVSNMPVRSAADGAALRRGRVLVGVPDHHLVVRDGVVHLGRGPRENGHRPAVDPLFRSAARWHGRHVVGVILSGALDDGAAGALTVATRGGAVLVQDPEDAMYDGMPAAAYAAVPDACVARLDELGAALVKLVTEPIDAPIAVDPDHRMGVPDDERRIVLETAVAELDNEALQDPDRPGTPAGLACPDCHGALFEIQEQSFLRYRCRVGHAWSPESLLVEQSEELETALWMALRALEERAALHRRLADSARAAGRPHVASSSDEQAIAAARSAELIRDLILHHNIDGAADAAAD